MGLQLSAHAQNHVSIERCRKSLTTIFVGVREFPLTGSNFGNMTAFRAIFSHIFTAHAQKWLLVNFGLKFLHQHSIPCPRFPYWALYFRDSTTFSVIFALDNLNVRHIATSGLVDLLTWKVFHVVRTSR